MYNRHATKSSWQALAMIIQDVSIDSKFKKKKQSKGQRKAFLKRNMNSTYYFLLLLITVIVMELRNRV